MLTLKCEFCGFEQIIKKRLDKYTRYELTHCKHLWCPCNKCKETHPRPTTIEEGLVEHGWVLGEWVCLLSEEDAAYVQPHQKHGYWSKIINPTIEERESLLRAKQLAKIGSAVLRMLQKETNE